MDSQGSRFPLDIHRKQAAHLYRNKFASPVFNVAAAAIFAILLWQSIEPNLILIWVGVVTLVNGGRLGLALYYNGLESNGQSHVFWIKVYVVAAIISALALTSVVVITPLDQSSSQILIIFMAGTLTVLALPTLAIIRGAINLYVIALIVPIAARVLLTGEIIQVSVGGLALLFVVAIYYTGRDIRSGITEAFRNELAVEKLAHSDPLTRVANRRMFDEALVQEWGHALRGGTLLSLVLADIDDFKAYNDGYGHSKGDDCLQAVADALRSALPRGTDVLARYGGEEFAVILPFTDAHGGMVVAERLRRAVADVRLPHKHSTVGRHLSITAGGVTCQPAPEMQTTRMIELADLALYQAKARGKNRVEWGDWAPESAGPEFTIRQRTLSSGSA